MDDDFTTSSIEKEQSNEALDLVHAMLQDMSRIDKDEEVVIQKERSQKKERKKEHKPKEKKSKNVKSQSKETDEEGYKNCVMRNLIRFILRVYKVLV